MSLGARQRIQGLVFLHADELPQAPTVPFFEKLNEVLERSGFDECLERLCKLFHAAKLGRPSLPPGVYFRMLLLGYLLGLHAERASALQASDTLSLREFLGSGLNESTPDHSTLCRPRQRLDLETHQQVFAGVLARLRAAGLAPGETVGVDATTLAAHAALSTLQRRNTQEGSGECLERLAASAGLETPTQAELLECDRQRQNQSLANQEWEHPVDPDARVARRKDGAPDRAPKAEHAVDLDSGALVGLTVQAADLGDTATLGPTLAAVAEAQGKKPQTVVADQGYPSGATVLALEESGQEPVIPEPKRQPRQGEPGREAERAAVEANRERIAGERGRQLERQRCEQVARSTAPRYATGGMRRIHLRGRSNILKRLLIHACGYNLGVLMRSLPGIGTPRSLQGGGSLAVAALIWPGEGLGKAPERLLSAFSSVWAARPARARARSLARRSLRCVPPRLGGDSDSALYQRAPRSPLIKSG